MSMRKLTRRQLGVGLSATVAGTAGLGRFAIAQGAARLVVIGGGPAGATVANQVKQGEPKLDVTLIEPTRVYTTCFFSNLYLGGFRTLQSLQHNYDGLRRLGIKVVPA